MPRKCCVPECKSNYNSTIKETGLISTFSFPKDQEKKEAWIRAIPRKNWNPSPSAVVCENHFDKKYIILHDIYKQPDGTLKELQLRFPWLSSDAVPHIFPNLPSYLSSSKLPERTDPESRRETARQLKGKEANEEIEKDKIWNFKNFVEQVPLKIKLPSWHYKICDVSVSLYTLNVDLVERPDSKIDTISSIVIYNDLSVRVFLKDHEIEAHDLKDIFPNDVKIRKWSEVSNLLSKYSSLSEYFVNKETDLKYCLEKASKALDDAVQTPEYSDFKYKNHLDLIRNQVHLISGKKRYFCATLTFAFMVFSMSAACYKVLKDYIIFPHKRYLQKISSTLNVSCSTDYYLQQMSKYLSEREKYVYLLMDEIYVNSCLTFKGQNVVGFAENVTNSQLAKTVQSYMISSCFGNFKEMVKLFPVKNLTGEQLYNFTLDIIKFLQRAGFTVLAVISDNNRINQNMFHIFSPTESIQNPDFPDKHIFFTYDFVHIFKNIRNNWLNVRNKTKTFIFPDFENNSIVREASFEHLRDFHKSEMMNVIKKAWKLNNKSLYPTTFERQNVTLIDNVFHESTIAALKKVPGCEGTVIFLSLIRKWWDIVNTKNTIKGKIKRNPWATPIFSVNDSKLEFLKQFILWINRWRAMKDNNSSLSRDTFEALERSTVVLIKISEYALSKLPISYVLPGKLQTDNLEKRFGQYRSMSGCNYNISFQQILESEKKIRARHIFQLMGKKEFSFKDMKLEWDISFSTSVDITDFLPLFSSSYLEECELPDEPEIVYVCGYASHSVAKKLSCDMCKDLIVAGKGNDIDDEYFDHLQRGGLSVPTNIMILSFLHIISVFQFIVNSSEFSAIFFQKSKQKNILIHLAFHSLQSNNAFVDVDECVHSHQFSDIVHKSLFIYANILLNNYTKCINNISEQNVKKRKLQPLGF